MFRSDKKLGDLLAEDLTIIVISKTKCLLCNKELHTWSITYNIEQHLRTEYLVDVLPVGVSHLINTAL